MNRFYPEVALRAQGRCEYCRAPERVFNFTFEVEHILPRAAGGMDTLENLALACESCNLHKSDSTAAWDSVEARNVPIFDPRRDLWKDHFAFDPVTAELLGQTAVGRGTIARLKLNSIYQLRARLHWMRFDLFP